MYIETYFECIIFLRDAIMTNLNEKPVGAFVLRISGSRKQCLALSIRIPEEKGLKKISNYLIVRNEQGFKIKVRKNFILI